MNGSVVRISYCSKTTSTHARRPVMSLQSVEQLSFGFLPSLPIKIEISPALLSSDAGLLPVREFDERIGLTEQFAQALGDERHPSWMEQSNLVMVRHRI